MDEKNLKIIRYLTGIILVVQFIVSAVILAGRLGWYSWYDMLAFIVRILGILLMAVSLFIGTHSLLAIGAGMQSVGILLSIIFENYAFSSILLFIAYALIALTTCQEKNSITIGIVSATLFIINGFWDYCVGADSFWEALQYTLYDGWTVLSAAAAIMICVVVWNTPQIKPIKTSQPTIAQKPDNCIEKLTKLKDLLDAGAITQEEFDAKKKQILWM